MLAGSRAMIEFGGKALPDFSQKLTGVNGFLHDRTHCRSKEKKAVDGIAQFSKSASVIVPKLFAARASEIDRRKEFAVAFEYVHENYFLLGCVEVERTVLDNVVQIGRKIALHFLRCGGLSRFMSSLEREYLVEEAII